MKRSAFLAIGLLIAAPASAKSADVSRARYLMGTVCEITVDRAAEAQIEPAFAEAVRIESMLSTWRDDTELARLNRTGDGDVSPELFEVLRTVMAWCERTGAAFDPLVAPLVRVWRTRADGALPEPSSLRNALRRADPALVSLHLPRRVTLSGGAAFEEGGFGKGYAIDRMLATLATSEVVVNFGGQLGVRGSHRVAVADPERRDRPVLAFTMGDGSLSTSSGSEKTFQVGGRRFSHIIDPRSGEALPPRGSTSVICDDALTADILSTALYVMGSDDGLRWAEANGVAALFITPDHHIRMSQEFRRRARSLEILDRNLTSGD